MSLILYEASETEFYSNGLGILAEAMDAEVYEELNGQFELSVRYPVTGRLFRELQNDRYVTAEPAPGKNPQPFRIYRITKPLAGTVTVHARHWAYNLQKVVVMPFLALTPGEALEALQSPVNPHPFQFWTNKENSGLMIPDAPKSAWALMGSGDGGILDIFGGEYEFDGKEIRLWKRRFSITSCHIRYGKNLRDLQMEENIANVYTGVVPYWIGEGSLGVTEMVTLEELAVRAEGSYTEDKLMPLDLSGDFEEPPTQAQLREQAALYIQENEIGKPDVNWTVDFVQLQQTEEYKDAQHIPDLYIGSDVTVYVEKLDVDVESRVVAATYLPLTGRYKTVTLGKVKANMATTVARQSQTLQSVTTSGGIDAGRVVGTLKSQDMQTWFNLAAGAIRLAGSTGANGDTVSLRLKDGAIVGSLGDTDAEMLRIWVDASGAHITGNNLTLLGKQVEWKDNGNGSYTLTGIS